MNYWALFCMPLILLVNSAALADGTPENKKVLLFLQLHSDNDPAFPQAEEEFKRFEASSKKSSRTFDSQGFRLAVGKDDKIKIHTSISAKNNESVMVFRGIRGNFTDDSIQLLIRLLR